MNLGLDFTKRLQRVDHWDLIAKLSTSLSGCACDIDDIHDSLSGRDIATARKELAINLARVEVYKEIVRMKLSVMDGEWDEVLKSQLAKIEQEIPEMSEPSEALSILSSLI